MNNPAIGTPVAIIHHSSSGFGRNRITFSYSVKAVTPSGRVTVVDAAGKERQFDAKGSEVAYKGNYVSPSTYNRDALRFDVDALRAGEAEHARKVDACNAFAKLFQVGAPRATWDKASIQSLIVEVKALLAAAEAAVEAI